MDGETLREVQAPLKQLYRDDPATALVTLNAQGRLGEGVTCSIDTGRALVAAGLHPASGGDGLSACSGDLLLQALVACAGVTLLAVATSLGLDVVDGTVSAQGDLDFRGTMAVDRETPVGFQAIRLQFDLVGSLSDEDRGTLLRLTERYCVVWQTLSRLPDLSSSLSVTSAPAGSPG
jgi:uncharacterized OsmC-like protein